LEKGNGVGIYRGQIRGGCLKGSESVSEFEIEMQVAFKLKGYKEKIVEKYKLTSLQWDIIRDIITLDSDLK